MELYQIVDNLLSVELEERFLIVIMTLVVFFIIITGLVLWEERKYRVFILLPIFLFFLSVYVFVNKINYEKELRNQVKLLNYDECSCNYLRYSIENKELSDLNKKSLFETYFNKCVDNGDK